MSVEKLYSENLRPKHGHIFLYGSDPDCEDPGWAIRPLASVCISGVRRVFRQCGLPSPAKIKDARLVLEIGEKEDGWYFDGPASTARLRHSEVPRSIRHMVAGFDKHIGRGLKIHVQEKRGSRWVYLHRDIQPEGWR